MPLNTADIYIVLFFLRVRKCNIFTFLWGVYLIGHRRKGYFLPGGGGAVNHLPKKIFASCSNFYKTVEQKRGPMQQHRPYWHMKMARYRFSESIPAKFVRKLCRHKQTFEKIATTVVLDKDENLL